MTSVTTHELLLVEKHRPYARTQYNYVSFLTINNHSLTNIFQVKVYGVTLLGFISKRKLAFKLRYSCNCWDYGDVIDNCR